MSLTSYRAAPPHICEIARWSLVSSRQDFGATGAAGAMPGTEAAAATPAAWVVRAATAVFRSVSADIICYNFMRIFAVCA